MRGLDPFFPLFDGDAEAGVSSSIITLCIIQDLAPS